MIEYLLFGKTKLKTIFGSTKTTKFFFVHFF